MDLGQWKVREKSEISLTLHDLFLTFPSTFFDWNSTSQWIKSQLKSSKLLDFHQYCLTFPWTFLDFLWLLSQVSVSEKLLDFSLTFAWLSFLQSLMGGRPFISPQSLWSANAWMSLASVIFPVWPPKLPARKFFVGTTFSQIGQRLWGSSNIFSLTCPLFWSLEGGQVSQHDFARPQANTTAPLIHICALPV